MYRTQFNLPPLQMYGGSTSELQFTLKDLRGRPYIDVDTWQFDFVLTEYETRSYDDPTLVYTCSAGTPDSHFSFSSGPEGETNVVTVSIDPQDTARMKGKYIYQLSVISARGFRCVAGQGIAEIADNMHPGFIEN